MAAARVREDVDNQLQENAQGDGPSNEPVDLEVIEATNVNNEETDEMITDDAPCSVSELYNVQDSCFVELSDFIVVGVDGLDYKVHRLILATHSLHFRETIFAHQLNKESKEGKYRFSEEIDPSNVLKYVIDYMYTGKIAITPARAIAFLKIADFLQMPKLLKLVDDYIHESSLARFRIEDLFSLPLDFLLDWLNSDNLRVDSEDETYNVVASMVDNLPEFVLASEPNIVEKLWRCVRLSGVSREVLASAERNKTVPRDLLLKHAFYALRVPKLPDSTEASESEDSGSSSQSPNYVELRYGGRKFPLQLEDSPFVIHEIKFFVKDMTSNLNLFQVAVKEYMGDEIDGWCLNGKIHVFEPRTVSSLSKSQWHSISIPFRPPFEWHPGKNLLIEFASYMSMCKGKVQLFDGGSIRSIVAESSHLIRPLPGMNMSERVKRFLNQPPACDVHFRNCLPKLCLYGRIKNKLVKAQTTALCRSSNDDGIFSQGSTRAVSKWMQCLYKKSDFVVFNTIAQPF